MKTFKTPKGTELPLMDIKGKDYLQVAHRLVWFREEKPEWTIYSDFLKIEPEYAIAYAEIRNEEGRVIARAHKMEDKKGFFDYIEKAQSGSIGRALAMCGYGTQFADELDEGHRIVDAPLVRPKQPSERDLAMGNIIKLTKEKGIGAAEMIDIIGARFGKESSKELTIDELLQLKRIIESEL